MKELRVNERIRIAQVRVIGADGAQLGIMSPAEGLRIAKEQGFDLVEVSPTASPPVCRILDYNKLRYDEQRREREAKKKHHVTKLKEVKFKPRIEEHDYQVKISRLKRFLSRGDQTKVTMVFRGREMAHTEIGARVMDRVVEDLVQYAKLERKASLEGRMMTMILGPDKDGIRKIERDAARGTGRKDSGKNIEAQIPAPQA